MINNQNMNVPSTLYLHLNEDDYNCLIYRNELHLSYFPEPNPIKLIFSNKKNKVELSLGTPNNAIVLSTYLSDISNAGNMIVTIVDVVKFLNIISSKLNEMGYKYALIGDNCLYNDKVIECSVNDEIDIQKQLGFSNNGVDMNVMNKFIFENCDNDLCYSELKSKKQEQEYRIVWLTDKVINTNIKIVSQDFISCVK